MRRFVLLISDIALIGLATVCALFLRENFNVTASRWADFLPYFLATVATGLVLFSMAGLNRTLWRFSSVHDHLRVTAVMAATVAGAAAIGFAYNRLDGIARSLPFLQFLACAAFLTGARALHKLAHEARHHRKAAAALLRPAAEASPHLTVLIVGISQLAEAYLQAVAELAPGQINIAGLAGGAERHAGRLLAAYPVLGRPEHLGTILDRLEIQGVTLDRIVVALAFSALSTEVKRALLDAERARDIELRFLAEDMGLTFASPEPANPKPEAPRERKPALLFEIPPAVLKKLAARRYWAVKRAIDCVGALLLLALLSPVMLLIALLLAGSLGSPVLFVQQRPGLGGRPFRLYKFRTMRAAHSAEGRRLAERERASRLGTVLRRLRADELPQLLNILRGDMSFAGPRPLLPWDQSEAFCARLLVRPGLTGWAQVAGGREIAPVDKATLDVWYVLNASLALDIEIALRTVFFVLFGERICTPLIAQAWRDLSKDGVLREERVVQV